MVKELFDGMVLREEQFLVSNFTKLTSASGNAYANIVLQDNSGTIEAKKWSIDSEDIYVFKPGNIVSINGEVLSYKGNLQIKLLSGRELDPELVDLSKFLIQSKFSLANLKERYLNILEKIDDKEYLSVVKDIYDNNEKAIFEYPAAKRNHHNYLRGLITHTISMAESALFLANKYENINLSLLLSGALLHDVGKIIELSGASITTYTTEGALLGHISLGFYMVRSTCEKLKIDHEKAVLLEHMILSHHGKLEYGSPVLPMTKEAILLAMIDDMDAKMEMSDYVLENLEEGELSNRIFALDERQLLKHSK